MAGIPIHMSQLKQIIILLSQGHPIKGIARETGVSRNTIKGYLQTITSQNLSITDAIKLDTVQLEYLLRAPLKNEQERRQDFLLRLEKLREELNQPHVTKQLLWEEYKREKPDGYQYSQFCYYLELYDRSQRATLTMEHAAGDKLFIDFSGDKLSYVDRSTGEIIRCEVFIATLGYSNFTVAVATHSQKVEDVVFATVKSLNCIGGVPCAIVPDNMKSAVIYSSRYEPVLNQVFLDMANHYGMAVLPTRAGKPKDKAKVERAVNITYQRVFAPLRKRTFYSLEELNVAISEHISNLNERKMQQGDHSRKVLLERDERPLLKSLPEIPYEIKTQFILTVQNNCHVYVSKQKKYYSVPYRYIGFKVHLIISSELTRIYYQGDCVATHSSENTVKYNTNKDHLPSHHQIILNGTNEHTLRTKAESISVEVLEVIDRVLKNSKHPEQAYKTCQGIFSIANKTSNQILHESCVIALQFNVCTYRQIQRLAQGQYAHREPITHDRSGPFSSHENVRGAQNYK